MRKTTQVALALTVLAATIILIGEIRSVDSTGQLEVERVVDGDTLIGYYNGQKETVRLIGIDAPEIGECFSLNAAHMLAHITIGRTLRGETETKDRDKYGRLLLNLYTNGGRYINEMLVSKGAAMQMAVSPNTEHISRLYEAEKTADRLSLGLHREC